MSYNDGIVKYPYPILCFITMGILFITVIAYIIRVGEKTFLSSLEFIYWFPTRYIYDILYAISNLDDDDRIKNWMNNIVYIKVYNKLVSFSVVLIWIILNLVVFYLIGVQSKMKVGILCIHVIILFIVVVSIIKLLLSFCFNYFWLKNDVKLLDKLKKEKIENILSFKK